MRLFSAFNSLTSYVYDKAVQVGTAAVLASVNVAKTLVGSVVDVGKQEVSAAVNAVHEGITTLEQTATNVVTTGIDINKTLVSDIWNTATAAGNTMADLAGNAYTLQHDLFQGKIDPANYAKLISDLASGGVSTATNAITTTVDSLAALKTVYSSLNQGGSLHFGDSDGLLGINFIGSALGGNHDQGLIPDHRGAIGSLPFSIGWDNGGLVIGGETPLTALLLPILAPVAPLIAPLNLGGLGVTANINSEGLSFKLYGVAGPSYQVGVANTHATIETGVYNDIKLLSWNELTLKDLPVAGNIFNLIPIVKDLPLYLPRLDVHFDSKLYTQASSGIDVLGKGPTGQVEVIHDLTNDLSLIGGIANNTLHSALDGAGKVVLALFTSPDHSPQPEAIASHEPVPLVGIAASTLAVEGLAA
ncbi:hypothetical protein KFQ04_22890 [Pseudomonas synxantha]|nr:hypothetical protein KFQ04_22890 [Pseudomonas synxantha]